MLTADTYTSVLPELPADTAEATARLVFAHAARKPGRRPQPRPNRPAEIRSSGTDPTAGTEAAQAIPPPTQPRKRASHVRPAHAPQRSRPHSHETIRPADNGFATRDSNAEPADQEGENLWVESSNLHRAARRYLMERYDELCRKYAKLPRQRGADGYSLRARRIFPRYHVVQAMLVEVERLDPDHLPDLQHLAAALDRAAWVAQSPFTDPAGDAVQADVMEHERGLFSSAVDNWMSMPDLKADPVDYRRVLTPEESSGWRTRLDERWGVQAMSWYPMLPAPVPPDVLVLTDAAMQSRVGIARVRKALQSMGGRRVVELREYGADYLLDLDLFAPTYNGAQGVWSDDRLDWVAFASHEGTVAFGGLIASALPTVWKNLNDWRWSGW